MDKYVILIVDNLFKAIEQDLEELVLQEDLADALEYFESRSKMLVADMKKSLE